MAPDSSLAHGLPKRRMLQARPPTIHGLTVSTGQRTLLVAFDTDEELHHWQRALTNARDGRSQRRQTLAFDVQVRPAPRGGGPPPLCTAHTHVPRRANSAPQEITMYVTVGKSRVPAMDSGGSSDPYVEVLVYSPLRADVRTEFVTALGEDAAGAGTDLPDAGKIGAALALLRTEGAWTETKHIATEPLKKTLTPDFGVNVRIKAQTTDVIVVRAYDWDRLSSNDLIGSTVLLPEWWMKADAPAMAGSGRRAVAVAHEWPRALPVANDDTGAAVDGELLVGAKAEGGAAALMPLEVVEEAATGGAGAAADEATKEAEDEEAAARAVAAAAVEAMTPKKPKSEEEMKAAAAVMVQCAWRTFLAQKVLRNRRAAVQAKLRAAEERAAAIKLQGAWRVKLAKRRVREIRERNTAALAQKEREDKAALIMQGAVRRRMAQKRVAARRAEVEAELRAQEAEAAAAELARQLAGESVYIDRSVKWLADNEPDMPPAEALQLAKAAVKVQNAYRARLARLRVKKIREEREAELKQAALAEQMALEAAQAADARAAKERRDAMEKEMKEEESAAAAEAVALEIGADARNRTARLDLEEAKATTTAELKAIDSEEEMAIRIQRAFRHAQQRLRKEEALIAEADRKLVEQLKDLKERLVAAIAAEEAATEALKSQLKANDELLRPMALHVAEVARSHSRHATARARWEMEREKKKLQPAVQKLVEATRNATRERDTLEYGMLQARVEHDATVAELKELGRKRRAERKRLAERRAKRQLQAAQAREAAAALRRKRFRRVSVRMPNPLRARVVSDRAELDGGLGRNAELVLVVERVPCGIGLAIERVVTVVQVGADPNRSPRRTPRRTPKGDGGADWEPIALDADAARAGAAAAGPEGERKEEKKGGAGASEPLSAAPPAQRRADSSEAAVDDTNVLALAHAGVALDCRLVAVDGVDATRIAASLLERRITGARELEFEVPKQGAARAVGSLSISASASMDRAKLRVAAAAQVAAERRASVAARAKAAWQRVSWWMDNDPELEPVLAYLKPPPKKRVFAGHRGSALAGYKSSAASAAVRARAAGAS